MSSPVVEPGFDKSPPKELFFFLFGGQGRHLYSNLSATGVSRDVNLDGSEVPRAPEPPTEQSGSFAVPNTLSCNKNSVPKRP